MDDPEESAMKPQKPRLFSNLSDRLRDGSLLILLAALLILAARFG